MKNKTDFLIIFFTVVSWIMSCIVIYMILLKITGHSPTLDQIVVVIVSVNFAVASTLMFKFGRMEEFMKSSKITFKKIGDDFNKMKVDISDIKKDVLELKSDMVYMKNDVAYMKKDIKKIENKLSS